MKKSLTYISGLFLALSLTTTATTAAENTELRIVSWGGVTSTANRIAYWDPFEKETGIKIVDDSFNGEIGRIRAQVMSQNIQWDIAEPEFSEERIGCLEGLYEPIDQSMLPMSELPESQVTECGVTSLLAATVLTYNQDRFPSETPATWADFWDVEKFPGKRGLPSSVKSNLVIALLADGVPREEVYRLLATEAGQDRAFDKLDELKDSIVWWTSGTQQTQQMISGDVVASAMWNGRAADAIQTQDQNFNMVWQAGWIGNGNRWVILKGSPNYDAAMKFIAFSTQAGPEAKFMESINYGSINEKAYDMISEERLAYLPGSPDHVDYVLYEDSEFWLSHFDGLTERFNNWAAR